MHPDEETITAIATPCGEGSLGVIRLSGDRALPIACKLFLPKGGNPLEEIESHRMVYGYIVDPADGLKVDEVMLTVMRAPHSYTREDVAEIFCHGGTGTLLAVLELALMNGARLAKPGEFTQRAFLNGRIDLLQAEAVIDLIQAQGRAGRQMALGQLEGRLSHRVRGIREKVLGVLAHLEASLDFPEEGLELATGEKLLQETVGVLDEVEVLLDGFEEGRILREGASAVIVGRPNVGKSSLMNLLLREDRAIVSPYPGTTRDVISESINLSGLLIKLKDTAGLGSPAGPIDAEGMERTYREIRAGDLILLVIDRSEEFSAQDEEILSFLEGMAKRVIVVLNKVDLPARMTAELLGARIMGRPICPISALEGTGIQGLKERLEQTLRIGDRGSIDSALLCRLRHKELLIRTQQALANARGGFEEGSPEELIALDLRQALDPLGELTGEHYSEDLLDRIFQEFCIGK